MSNRQIGWCVVVAKIGAIAGFLMLVYGTYALRSEVLVLSEIRFSSDEVRVRNDLEELEESFPARVEQYEMNLRQYELQQEHYREMLALYRTDYDAYVQRVKDKYTVPVPPNPPSRPKSPEVAQELYEINAAFRSKKHDYFENAIGLNRLATFASLTLVGSLVFLLMFDIDSPRWHYLAALVLSFVFLIGPAFHSILTGLIGVMSEPSVW